MYLKLNNKQKHVPINIGVKFLYKKKIIYFLRTHVFTWEKTDDVKKISIQPI